MLNEYHKVEHPEVIVRQPAGIEPPANIEKPLVDTTGEPLLPRVVARLRAEMGAAEPRRPRSVVDAGEAYPAIDHEKLYAYEALGRRLHARVTGDVLVAAWRWVAGLFTREQAPPVVGERARSVVDAGEPYPAIDHELLHGFEERGRRLHAIHTGEVLGRAARRVIEFTRGVFAEPMKPLVFRTGPAYWSERARYHGRTL